jgi:hypothetical protein
MNKQSVASLYNGVLLSHEEGKIHWDTCYNMDELLKYYAKWKQSVTTDYCVSIYIKCPEQANRDRK